MRDEAPAILFEQGTGDVDIKEIWANGMRYILSVEMEEGRKQIYIKCKLQMSMLAASNDAASKMPEPIYARVIVVPVPGFQTREGHGVTESVLFSLGD